MSNLKKKNFRIEGFRHGVEVEPCYGEELWVIIENAVHQIYDHHATDLRFEDLYRNAYNMVLHKFGERLYSGLVATMASHLQEMARSVEATQGSCFLEELNRKWDGHNKALQMIGDILMYMDRTYIQTVKKTTLAEVGLNLWSKYVFHSNQIRTRLLNMLLELIHSERSGEVVNRGLIRNMTKMLMDLGPSVYGREFENPFLRVSTEFYQAESQKLLACCGSGDYLKKAEMRLNEERDRVSQYLYPSTEAKIINLVEKEMLENHMLRLIFKENYSGLLNMLDDDKYDDLGRMYNLFSRVTGGILTIREAVTLFVKEDGKLIVTDPERLKDPVEFVQRLLDEKDKYNKIINLSFKNDKLFHNDLKSSFEFFMNLNPHIPEFLSLFVDDKLRKGLKGVSEDILEITLDKVIVLFRCLNQRDEFEKYYKQHLAKRFLSGKRVSDDVEWSFIVKLKNECGTQFTANLEGMFTDIKTSVDTMKSFNANHPELGDGPTLNVQVLTAGYWPAQSSGSCNLPSEMSALCTKFRSYYLSTHTGRKLTWQTSMGTAELKATFGNGQKYELHCSTYQMCVLMLFNNADRLSYKEIEQATEIPASDLKRCLQCLTLAKGRNVLKKEPMGEDVSEDDTFFVNDKFHSKQYKIEIGTVVAQNASELDKLDAIQKVEEDRKPQIQAAIVRVMKFRKQLDHNNLMAEVTKQLQSRFLANPMEIKKQIESLLEREFLERDGTDRKLYRYIA